MKLLGIREYKNPTGESGQFPASNQPLVERERRALIVSGWIATVLTLMLSQFVIR